MSLDRVLERIHNGDIFRNCRQRLSVAPPVSFTDSPNEGSSRVSSDQVFEQMHIYNGYIFDL